MKYTDDKRVRGQDLTTDLYSITDFGVNEKVYYHWVQLDTLSESLESKLNAVGFQVVGIKKDKTEVIIGQYDAANPNAKIMIADTTRQYDDIQIRFTTPLTLDNEYIRFLVKVMPMPHAFDDLTASNYNKSLQ